MLHDEEPSASTFPGFVILVAIAVLIVALVSVRQPMQTTRVWVPGSSVGTERPQEGARATCSSTCKSLNPA